MHLLADSDFQIHYSIKYFDIIGFDLFTLKQLYFYILMWSKTCKIF